LLDEGGRLSEAVDCEKRTLDADPKYADAMFNIALFLQRLERHAEAATRPRLSPGQNARSAVEVLRNTDGER
jgi:hypothetical protein